MTSKFNDIKRRVLILCAFFMVLAVATNASYIIVNDGEISQKVTQKVDSLGNELFTKIGVNVYVAVPNTIEKKTIIEYGNGLSVNLKPPYVLLSIAKNEQQIDIIYSKSLEGKFDKEAVLSPFPWSGTILPILTVKKDNDKYNAAVLNGYADIVEQIAASYDVVLDGAIGNTNKNIYHYLKIGIYGFLLFILGRYLYVKVRKKYE